MATFAENREHAARQAEHGASAAPRPRRQPGGGVRLATIGGIDVNVHASWLIIAGLVTWSLATSYFPAATPGADARSDWILGVIAALLLFASVLAHELAHSLVARSRGLDVRSITLFVFGGVSNLAGEARRPLAELQIAIVGPLMSFAIAGVAFGVALLVGGDSPVAAVAGYLAFINGALGVFNLVPGFPLDGGRVLRSIVWQATRDLRRATEIATAVGRIVAWGLMLWGFLRVANGDLFGGVWIAAIGWFLQNAATASLEQTLLDARLRRLRVTDVLRADPAGVAPSATVADLIEHYVLPGARRAVAVVDAGRLVGLVTLSDLRDVPVDERGTARVESVMTVRERLTAVAPTTSLRSALETLAAGDYEQVPVVEGDRLVGLLTRADILRELQIREELGVAEEPRREAPGGGDQRGGVPGGEDQRGGAPGGGDPPRDEPRRDQSPVEAGPASSSASE